MNAKNRWLLGLQWGACLWLPYVLWDAGIDFRSQIESLQDLIDTWPRFWWGLGYALFLPGWIATVVLLVAGSRWARPAVATMILLRVAEAGIHTYERQLGHADATLFVSVLAPVLPLVVLRLEEPRVVLALAALGRWREALARSGGVVALLIALAVLSTHEAAFQALVFRVELPAAFGVTGILTALAAVVTFVTWATHKRWAAMA
jgi:hypothetical protein